eukprot:scaffold62154_cov46-Phaeocystis_antarctica.AAC.1
MVVVDRRGHAVHPAGHAVAIGSPLELRHLAALERVRFDSDGREGREPDHGALHFVARVTRRSLRRLTFGHPCICILYTKNAEGCLPERPTRQIPQLGFVQLGRPRGPDRDQLDTTLYKPENEEPAAILCCASVSVPV